jgi:hypothetical protein
MTGPLAFAKVVKTEAKAMRARGSSVLRVSIFWVESEGKLALFIQSTAQFVVATHGYGAKLNLREFNLENMVAKESSLYNDILYTGGQL